jgi:hypothetical protein
VDFPKSHFYGSLCRSRSSFIDVHPPPVLVYNEAGCEVADRWRQAADRTGWYVNLKLFPNYRSCRNQPEAWHQYGVGNGILDYNECTTIAPGFWRSDMTSPSYPRVGRGGFCQQVSTMVQNNRDWQLIVSFNGALKKKRRKKDLVFLLVSSTRFLNSAVISFFLSLSYRTLHTPSQYYIQQNGEKEQQSKVLENGAVLLDMVSIWIASMIQAINLLMIDWLLA